MRVCAHCHRTLGDAERTCSRDGAEATEIQAIALPADLASRFTGIEPFAQTLNSACFLATQPANGFRGLLKVIPLRDLDASERGRLKRELRKQVKLGHPNLPRIVDGGELAADLWLLRDHVDGESLAQLLRREGPLELKDALAVLAQVASALDELHRAGILHRDVRPSRIVLQPREGVPIVKLLDAGIAARQRTGAVFDRLGTPAYMSPEQIAGKLVSFRSDLYALGCVLYELLTGKPPFGVGESPDALRAVLEAHQQEPPPALSADVPPAIASLLASLLDKDPRKRPFSAQQVRRTLEPLLPPGMPAATAAVRSVAGIPAPSSGARVSRPGSIPPPRRASSGPIVAPPPAKPRAAVVQPQREEITDELELMPDADVIASVSLAPGGFAERNTVDIPNEELSALRVEPSLMPTAKPEAPAVEVSLIAADDEPQVEPVASSPSPSPSAPPLAIAAGEPLPSSDAAPVVRRPSVAFDVESLFNDPEPEPPHIPTPVANPAAKAAEEDAAPTQLYQRRDDEAHRAYREAVENAEKAEGEGQDRTVVVRMPTRSSSTRLWAAAAGVGLLIVLFAVCRGGDEEPDVAAASQSESDGPPTAEQGAPGNIRGESQPASPANGTEQPGGGPAPAADVAPEPTGEPAAQAVPAEPVAAEPVAAEPVAAEPAPAAAAAVAPEATGATPGALPPADAPTPSDQGASPNSVTGSAPPARRNAPDAVVGQRASRTDRVAKATEHKNAGRTHYQAGRFRDAARSYELATRETPSDGGAFAGLGASLLAANDPDGAIRAYQRAVQVDGKSSGFHAALGRAYAMKGDRLRARTAYQRALELNPDNGAAKQGLAKVK
jgi:serine/threonine-protein kinase